MKREDAGFTLVEMLVSIVILGIITGPLTAALLVTFGDTATQLRVSEAHDKQISAVYFAPDVASTDTFRPATSCTVPSGTLVLGLRWTDEGAVTDVDYVLDGSGTEKTLYRYKCVGGSTSRVTLARQVLTASCKPAACSALTTASRTVQLVLTEADSEISLRGTRRATP